MAEQKTDKHPYTPGSGAIVKTIQQLRTSLPAKIDSSTIAKLGFAPNNESYVINVLRYLQVIDDNGEATPEAKRVFTQHGDQAFSQGFGRLVKNAYRGLFELHGDKAWTLDLEALVTFFRGTDQTSALVGRRQAATFVTLAALSGHGEMPIRRRPASAAPKKKGPSKPRPTRAPAGKRPVQEPPAGGSIRDLGLTVRIEINLPAAGDQQTYDRIFGSIRENLLNA